MFSLKESINYNWHSFFYGIENLQLEMTDLCNLACPTCFKVRDESGTFNGMLRYDQMIRFFDIILGKMKLKPRYITLNCTGESTIHPHFTNVMRYLEDNYEGLFFRLNSNLLNLDISFLAKLLKKNKLVVMPSVMAYDRESYIEHYGKDKFAEWELKLKELAKNRTSHFDYGIVHLAIKKDLTMKCLHYLKSLGINVKVKRIHGTKHKEEYFTDDTMIFLKSFYANHQYYIYDKIIVPDTNSYSPCVFFGLTLFLNSNGYLSNCINAFESNRIFICHINDITNKESFIKYLSSKDMEDKYIEYYKFGLPNKGICQSCMARFCTE